MADNENNAVGDGGNVDDQIEAATSIYEARLLNEATTAGLETIAARPTPATAEELGVLIKLARQAGDAMESAQRAVYRLFGIEIGHA